MASTILVIDDHVATCTLIARMLRDEGYAVATAGDGVAALVAAGAQRPDLVIADVLLPGLDGLTVIHTLRQQDPHLPVIAISAVHNVLTLLAPAPTGLDLGSIPFLPKPFALATLRDLVHQLLPHPTPS